MAKGDKTIFIGFKVEDGAEGLRSFIMDAEGLVMTAFSIILILVNTILRISLNRVNQLSKNERLYFLADLRESQDSCIILTTDT